MSSFNELTENIRVYLRIRPDEGNLRSSAPSTCLKVDESGEPAVVLTVPNSNKAEIYTFDRVGGPETPQEDIFEAVAKPVTEYCLQGYNGTIFAYGQTGSGKTFTMQGPLTEDGLIDFNQRGLIPRTFEYLFERIRLAQEEEASIGREFLCKCSYVEIYNESIFDLLDPSDSGTPSTCTLREDIKRGVWIEGAKEEVISSPSEAYEVYERGGLNRHVAQTSMNRESSRSHCVFTLFIQSKERVGEIVDVQESRFNLVDLAGSERQQFTGTTGLRLKEAGNINKSLLALSNVINALVDISHGRPRHVHYRDSRLTFLLRDSLGGNAKTVIIANVSSQQQFVNETLSTLKFAQRAKMIKNKAIVNKDIQGNVLQLQAEIQRLQHELYLARHYAAAGVGEVIVDAMTGDLSKKVKLSCSNSSLSSNATGASSSSSEMDAAEAYLMLTMALERQAESSDELESLKSKVGLLEELVKRKESQNQSIRMVLKFRENSLHRQEQPSPAGADENEELVDLKKEIQELRKIIEHHPDVTRYAYENLQLREKLYKYEAWEKRMNEFEGTLQRHRQYEQLLTNRLLTLEKMKTASLVLSSGSSLDGDDEDNESISMHPMNVSGDFDGKPAADWNALQSQCEELKSGCDALFLEREELRSRCQGLQSQLNVANDGLRQRVGECEDLKAERDVFSLRCEEGEIQAKKLSEQVHSMNSRISSLSAQEKAFTDLRDLQTKLQAQLEGAVETEDDGRIDYRKQMETWKSKAGLMERQISYLEATQQQREQGLSSVLEAERGSSALLLSERDSLNQQLEALKKALDREAVEFSHREQELRRELASAEEKLSQLNGELQAARRELEDSLGSRKNSQSEMQVLKQELEFTRQVLAEHKSRTDQLDSTALGASESATKKIVQLEADIAGFQAERERLESAVNQVTGLTERNKILQAENGQLHGKIGKLEFLLRNAQGDNDELMGQVSQLQKHLESHIAGAVGGANSSNNGASGLLNDLKGQLEVANNTIVTLKSQLMQLQGDLAEIRSENDRLAQHHNLKQKLQYHVKIKQENNELQEELGRCREELSILRCKQESIQGILGEMKKFKIDGDGEKMVSMIRSIEKIL